MPPTASLKLAVFPRWLVAERPKLLPLPHLLTVRTAVANGDRPSAASFKRANLVVDGCRHEVSVLIAKLDTFSRQPVALVGGAALAKGVMILAIC